MAQVTVDMDTIDLRNAEGAPVQGRHVDNLQGLLAAARSPAFDPGPIDGVGRMEPASGFDLDAGVPVFTGPDRISGAAAGTATVREAVRTGDFEAVLTWVVGVGSRAGFRVSTLTSPSRLVIDVGTG
jgi:hypothetical protein